MKEYTVQLGDTLAKLCYRYQTRKEDMLAKNPSLSSNGYLYPGKRIYLPEPIKGLYQENICYYEYGFRELEKDRIELSVQHGVTSEAIGTSRLGTPIWLFRIGTGHKKIFYSGTWHGNEWLNSWLLIQFIHILVQKQAKEETWYGIDIPALLKEVTLYIVPLVNPDGAELVQTGRVAKEKEMARILSINDGMKTFDHWSANAYGVDLNHQWPAGWKEEARTSPNRPFPRHYGGIAPLTEPEARAIYELTMREDFSHVIALHSQGEEIYWGYRGLEPEESKTLAERLGRVSSYEPVHTANSQAGYKDWFIKEFRRPGFTVETGRGQNPLPFQSSTRMWVTAMPLLLESCLFPNFAT